MTRADRLHRLIAKVAPAAAAEHALTGAWPNTHPQPGVKRDKNDKPLLDEHKQPIAARHSGAPYVMETLTGGRKISLKSDDGDVLAGVGPTIDDALSMLEKKCGIVDEQAGDTK